MLSKITSHLAGKAASYHLNAEADAADAQLLSQIITTKKTSPKNHYRLQQIFKAWPKNKTYQALAAYSLYYNNGYADHIFARLIAALINYQLPSSKHYPNTQLTLSDYFYPWADVLFNRHTRIQHFFEQHNLNNITFTHKELIDVVIHMQKINIQTNQQTIHAFSNDLNHWKIKAIRKSSQSTPHPNTFTNSAISTQKSAIFWDKVYILILNSIKIIL